MRSIHKNIPTLFEPYEWEVVEDRYSEDTNKNNETIFTLANGYLGVRGTFEEGYYGYPGNTNPGAFINGIYEYHDYHHIWCRPGYPKRYHSILNQVEPFDVQIAVDGEKIKLNQGKDKNYKRVLNMKDGLLTRSFEYTTDTGVTLSLLFERFVSLADKYTAAMNIQIIADKPCQIEVFSRLDGEIKRVEIYNPQLGIFRDENYTLTDLDTKADVACVVNKTNVSGFSIVAAMCDSMNNAAKEESTDECSVTNRYFVTAKPDAVYEFSRVVCYCTSRESKKFKTDAKNNAKKQSKAGYQSLKKKHVDEWNNFWDIAEISIKGDTAALQGVRFSQFHINQSAGKDGITNISANGLTGIGYQGHTFWDTEIFIMPMFTYTFPEVSRQLLMYRYNILDKARERATQMDDVGALFSWNSINGEECGYIFEAATAQYHINTDISYAIEQYMEATGDMEFMTEYGAEILFEISKCMAHRGNFIPLKDNKFCINVVCGPDEYTPIVDNNCYTNMLCRKQFYFALKTKKFLEENHPEKLQSLCEKCGVDQNEFDLWQKAADNMYIPYHKELEIYMQDDQFLYRDPIDIESIPVTKLSLLANLHPLNLWRYQVAKQADTVLLTCLCSEEFTKEMRKKIFDFYEPKTIHDSSLSAGVHSIAACDIGYFDEAMGYFKQTVRMDLDNVNRNTSVGIHAACMGSSWMNISNGFAGMRVIDGVLHFSPVLPEGWEEYSFKIRFQNSVIKIKVSKQVTEYHLLQGKAISFYHRSKEISLKEKVIITFDDLPFCG